MKRKRGLRRYFQALASKQMHIPALWMQDGSFSYDKIWIDHYGFRGINKRRPHLECMLRNFDSIATQMGSLNEKFQLWIVVNENNGKDDCIMLHSPNSFTIFPHQYEHLSSTNNFINSAISDYLQQVSDFKKLYGTA